MKVTAVLSTAILLVLPAAIVSAYAQEHEQEKQPAQKQQQAKPAQHQQQAKPAKQPQQAQQQQRAKTAKQPQQAQHQQQAKPAQQPQHAASRQQARPAKQQAKAVQHQQQADRGAQPAAGHGSIPEAKFRSSFGSGHRFHVNRAEFANGAGRFQYGGYWFNVLDPWPVGWLYTDDVYVDYLNGGYFLCDPIHPGVYISINIG
jgi:hypothetical protein